MIPLRRRVHFLYATGASDFSFRKVIGPEGKKIVKPPETLSGFNSALESP